MKGFNVFRKVIVVFFLSVSINATLFADNATINDLNFDYLVKHSPSQWSARDDVYQISSVYSDDSSTYIQFKTPNLIKQLPILYVDSESGVTTNWKWISNSIVINAPIARIKVVSPITNDVLYQIEQKKNYMPPLVIDRALRTSDLSGFYTALTLGGAAIEDLMPSGIAAEGSFGYLFAISKSWMIGPEVSGFYGQNRLKNNNFDTKAWSFALMLPMHFLITDHFDFMFAFGLAYAKQDSKETALESDYVPKFELGLDYWFNKHLSLGVGGEYLFGSSKLYRVVTYSANLALHF